MTWRSSGSPHFLSTLDPSAVGQGYHAEAAPPGLISAPVRLPSVHQHHPTQALRRRRAHLPSGSLSMGSGASRAAPHPPQLPRVATEQEIQNLKTHLQELRQQYDESVKRKQEMEAMLKDLHKEAMRKDREIRELRQEVDKLKSVLDQKLLAGSAGAGEGELLQDEMLLGGKVSTGGLDMTKGIRSKKHGVSGESGISTGHVTVELKYYEKDANSKELIREALLRNNFLTRLQERQITEMVECAYEVQVERDTFLIKEGDSGKHLYVSYEGSLEVSKGGKVLSVMEPGRAFGELALLYDCPRTASVRAVSEVKVWTLDRQVFQTIMMRTHQQQTEERLNFLKSVPLIKPLPLDKLLRLADLLERDFYPAGEYIVREGEVGQTFFIMVSGQVKVTQSIRGSTQCKEIRHLSKGDYFGEKALLSEDVRSANVIAEEPGVEVLTLDRLNFHHLIGNLDEWKARSYESSANEDEDIGQKNAVKDSQKQSDLFKLINVPTLSSRQDPVALHQTLSQQYKNVELDELEFVATLGMGGFGWVKLVVLREDKSKSFALKCLNKQHIVDTKQQIHVVEERKTMLMMNHDLIVHLYRTFRDAKFVYMLLEACLGGEVWSILRDRDYFDDTVCRFMIACVLETLEYMHDLGIIYRDMKPENMLLDTRGYVKLCDFGFAKCIGKGHKTWTFCGTTEYVSPEILLNKGHDFATDLWSLGILMFELLTGNPPFSGNEPMQVYNCIVKGVDALEFPRSISPTAGSLIKRLCRENPAERLGYGSRGIEDIRQHKYFQGFDWHGIRTRTYLPPIIPKVGNPLDASNFDEYYPDSELPPDELSGWDKDF